MYYKPYLIFLSKNSKCTLCNTCCNMRYVICLLKVYFIYINSIYLFAEKLIVKIGISLHIEYSYNLIYLVV